MTTAWSPQKNQNFGSTEAHFFAIPGTDTVLVGYYDGTANVKVQKSLDGGNTFAAAVVVDATAGTNDVMLNEPWCYDAVNNRLFLCYGRNVDVSGSKAVLCLRYSDDQGATWSAEKVLDDGTVHANPLSFYRVGAWANNGVVSIHYSYEGYTGSADPFKTDGLWRIIGTYTGTGAITWGSTGKVYTSTVIGAYEPNAWGTPDGTVLVSWYDDGVNNNQGGDLYVARSLDNGATWDAAPTKLTTTTDYGRPRPKGENGNWWIVANKPWPGSVQDTYTLTSTDNGVTWGAPTLRVSHNPGFNTSHPDVAVQDQFVGILVNRTDGGHAFIYSTDGGSTFSSETNPFGDASTSDSPQVLVTNSYIFAAGYDTVNSRSIWAMNPFFAVLPQSQTPTLDNFTRAAENPLSEGGKWTQGSVIVGTTGNALKTNGTKAVRQSAAGTFDRSASYWNQATYTGNVEAWATVASIGGESDLGIGDPTGKNGYYLATKSTDFYTTDGLTLEKDTANTSSTLGTTGADGGTQASDSICLQLVGNQVVGWRYRGGVWSEKFRVVDSAFRASLRISLDIAGNVNAGDAVSAFGGGSLSAPVNSVVPAISGSTTPGSVLRAGKGTWSNGPTRYAYQWQKDGANITGARLPWYTIQSGDVGHTITVVVTATNQIGAASISSSGVVPSNAASGSFVGGFVRDAAGALVRGSGAGSYDGGFVRDASDRLLFGASAPFSWQNGFLRDSSGALVESAGPGTMVSGLRRDSSGALVTVASASAVAPLSWVNGFLCDANGALVTD